MFPEFTVVVGFLIGTFIGSFLNVVVYRLPRGMSLVKPPSHCPACRHRLGAADLIPVFSYLLSGRKCRYCRVPVSSRYFWVEVLTGAVWGAFWWQNLVAASDPARFLLLALSGSVLVAVIFIDIGHYIIPDSLNAWLLIFGLGYNAWLIGAGEEGAWTQVGALHVPSAVAGALLGVLVFWGIAVFGRLVFRKDAMGHGDIKLARGIGAVLFAGPALLAFGLSVAVGAILGLVQVVLRAVRPEDGEGSEEIEEGLEQPESFGSLLKCGLGYLLFLDAFGLLIPRLEKWWFGEEPQAAEDAADEWRPSFTTIPFGPYLAVGAILAALFDTWLLRGVESYWRWATGQ